MCEPGIANYLHRYFLWYENTYFTQELPKNCSVYLSGNDDIVNTKLVTEYLNRHSHVSRKVAMMENMRHGQLVLHPAMSLIFEDIKKMSQ